MPKDELDQDTIMPPRVRRCDNGCRHYDDFNNFCWSLWYYIQEGDRCKAELKDDMNVQY